MRTVTGVSFGMLSWIVTRPWKFSLENTDSGAATSSSDKSGGGTSVP